MDYYLPLMLFRKFNICKDISKLILTYIPNIVDTIDINELNRLAIKDNIIRNKNIVKKIKIFTTIDKPIVDNAYKFNIINTDRLFTYDVIYLQINCEIKYIYLFIEARFVITIEFITERFPKIEQRFQKNIYSRRYRKKGYCRKRGLLTYYLK